MRIIPATKKSFSKKEQNMILTVIDYKAEEVYHDVIFQADQQIDKIDYANKRAHQGL